MFSMCGEKRNEKPKSGPNKLKNDHHYLKRLASCNSTCNDTCHLVCSDICTMATESQIVDWVEKSMEKQQLKNREIKITGNSEKDEGYMGDIVFVAVGGITDKGERKVLYVVVKHAKVNEHMRKTMPVEIIFNNEIYMYSKVIPAFQIFQREKQVDIFDCLPECYYTSSSENTEVLVLDNLRAAGYLNHDRKKPMNSSHCRAVLRQLGRFHAVSFAMRDQHREEFCALVSGVGDPMKWFMNAPDAKTSMDKSQLFVSDLLKKNGDLELYNKFEKLRMKLPVDMEDIFTQEEPQNVITHGDPWCNNFLFKYEGPEKTIPSKVAILDWQMSALRSPTFDLSYFFYAVCSKTELDSFDELLKFYHDTLASHMIELGSNPEELFSYSDLKRHWRRYSIFGLTSVIVGLKLFLCDKKNAPDFGGIEEGENFMDLFTDVPLEETTYYNRIKPVISHYFDFIENK